MVANGLEVWQNGYMFIYFSGFNWHIHEDTTNTYAKNIALQPDLNSYCPYKSDNSRIRDLLIEKHLN